MERIAEEFVRRRQLLGWESMRGRRYPESLRQLAVSFCREALAGGWSLRRVANRLGIREVTLARWRREPSGPRQRPPMREVVVVDEPEVEAVGATLVTPEGFRIEGLRGAELVEVLRALRS